MKQIIEAVSAQLAAKVPELNFIDVDLEQLQLDQPPVDFPCALIDVSDIDYTNLSPGLQRAQADISITLGFKEFAPSSYHSTECRAESLAHYDIVSKVAEALHGFTPTGVSTFTRTKLMRRSQTYPRHYVMIFRTAWQEAFDKPQIPVRPEVIIKNPS